MVAELTKERILETLRRRKSDLQDRYPLRDLALFGSWARGDQTSESDVDILVDVEPSIGLRIVSLAEEIERDLGVRVDLVSRRAIKPTRIASIERDLIHV